MKVSKVNNFELLVELSNIRVSVEELKNLVIQLIGKRGTKTKSQSYSKIVEINEQIDNLEDRMKKVLFEKVK